MKSNSTFTFTIRAVVVALLCSAFFLSSFISTATATSGRINTLAPYSTKVAQNTSDFSKPLTANEADTGRAGELSILKGSALAVDTKGSVFVSDSMLLRIVEITNKNYRTLAVSRGKFKNGQAFSDPLRLQNPPMSECSRVENAMDTVMVPVGVAVKPDGRLIVADHLNHILEVSDGKTKILAGRERSPAGFSPDGTDALEAQLNQPNGIAIDHNGDILFTERENSTVRRIHDGKIYTVAGNGTRGYSGDGGRAQDAQLNGPEGLVIGERGEIYVADTYNDRIRVIENGIIRTFVGTGEAGFNGHTGHTLDTVDLSKPGGLAYHPKLGLLFSEWDNHIVRLASNKDNCIITIAGTGEPGFSGDRGPADKAQLHTPTGIAVTKDNQLLISEVNNQCIRCVDLNPVLQSLQGPEDLAALAAMIEESGSSGTKKGTAKAGNRKKGKGKGKGQAKGKGKGKGKKSIRSQRAKSPGNTGTNTDVEDHTTPSAKQQPQTTSQRSDDQSQYSPVITLEDYEDEVPAQAREADKWKVAGTNPNSSGSTSTVSHTLFDQTLALLTQGTHNQPELERLSRRLTAELLPTFDDQWQTAWESHIHSRHGSKLRAIAHQLIDRKERSYFTVGRGRTQKINQNIIESFADRSVPNLPITYRWESSRDEENVYSLILETPRLLYGVGRKSDLTHRATDCNQVRLVLTLRRDGLSITTSYPFS